MARKPYGQRLAPPLMHVFRAAFEAKDSRLDHDLRDEAGNRVIASRRQRPGGVVSDAVLKAEASREIVELLNASPLEAAVDLTDLPEVRASVLNYGLREFGYRTPGGKSLDEVAAEIEGVLARHQHRLVPESIRVAVVKAPHPDPLRVRFKVHAELRADPVDVPIEFVAEVDVGARKIKVDRLLDP